MWMYTGEVCPSFGMPIVAFANQFFAAFFGAFTIQFFKLFTPAGFYVVATGIQVGTLVFLIIFVKETSGLSKKELEHLYHPGSHHSKNEEEVHNGICELKDESGYSKSSDS